MERRIELRHQRWKFQESPISSSPPSLFQKFPLNSLPASVKPPPKGINEHPIYARGNRFLLILGEIHQVSCRWVETKREREEKTGPFLVSGVAFSAIKMDPGRGGTAEGKHQVVSLCEIISTEESGKWAFVSVMNERRGKGRCAINVDVDGKLVEFREEKMWNGRIVGKELREIIFFWSCIFDIN